MNEKKLAITDDEFFKLKTVIYDNFGINLTENKRNLLIGRLQSLLRKYNFPDFNSYYNHVVNDAHGAALSELVNRISTNFTYFYREEAHFKFLESNLLPELVAKLRAGNSKDIRLWCAGCASGEEPYTIIMLLMNYFKHDYGSWDAGILATDISEKALNFAKEAKYPFDRINKLPPALRNAYFEKLGDDEYKIVDKVQREVTYRRFNLMNKQFPFKKKFHAIFCRNVMIYFDKETKDDLVERYVRNLEPGGYLFIGHSESLGKHNPHLEYVMPAVYRKKM